MSVQISVTQTNFRTRNDDGSEASATWSAALNTNPSSIRINTNFRIRFSLLTATGTTHNNLESATLFYNKNGGGWTQVTSSSSNVKLSTSSNVADQTVTTQQITAGGTFNSGNVQTSSTNSTGTLGTSALIDEFEYCLQLTSGIINGDTVQFRVYGATSGALDTYTNTPSIVAYDGTVSPAAARFFTFFD